MSSFLAAVTEAVRSTPGGAWCVEAEDRGWIHVMRTDRPVAAQGWKLHLSASQASAADVLRRALPVLLAEGASFKLTASYDELNDLNEGNGGLSQVGKFLTMYPDDELHAVRLAVALDEATRGLSGPRIPSDRPLRSGSLVHYRYGGFGDLFVQTRIGQIVPALRAPDGELVPDERRARYEPPAWASDPFVAAGVAAIEAAGARRVVGGRYLIVATLHESPRGTVLSAIDVTTPRTCVIKHAHRHALVGRDGRDASDRLRHEMRILGRLAPDDRFPEPLDLIEEDDGLFLAMTEIEGMTLEQRVRERTSEGRCASGDEILTWARELAAALDTIHGRGVIYRDLKSSNVIVRDDGHVAIVDFELAGEIGGAPVDGRGTRGYVSPQQDEGRTPSVADDVYGLGAVLYLAATGAESSLAPRPFHLLERPIELLNPNAPPGLIRVIERCLEHDPRRRFPSMAAVESALVEMEKDASGVASVPVLVETQKEPRAVTPAPSRPSIPAEFDDDPRRYRGLAERLADTLCRVARTEPGGGVFWVSTHEIREGIPARDLCSGSAGPVLALADLVGELAHEDHRDVLARAARALAATRPSPAGLLPGFYVGEAGVGAALLRAGQVLGDESLVDSALAQGRLVASSPHASPDMYNGTAGRLRYHLLLWHETSDKETLRHATEAGAALLKCAEGSKAKGTWWTIPPGYGGLSGTRCLGYAHGAAGIADALLDLFEVNGDEQLLVAARRTGRWIARHAVPTLDDGSGLDWPDAPEGTSIGPFWCHGAAGIGQFFLHAAGLGVMPEAGDLALRAARAAARGARWSGPTQCHGLAGNIELLLDVFQATRDVRHLDEAQLLGRLLQTFGTTTDGLLVWPSESPTTVTPDYTVGYAGVAVCLLRLSAPERLPRQLSRRGFAHNARAPVRPDGEAPRPR